MTRSRLDQQLALLNEEMIAMGGLCEETIRLSDQALRNSDREAIRKAMDMQGTIKLKEKNIEALCMRLLLLQQPMAQDLTTVSAALKMITDMSRIGEIAGDMSEVIGYMNGQKGTPLIREMATRTENMVTMAIDSFVHENADLARQVIAEDDVIDQMFLESRRDIIQMIQTDQQDESCAVDLIMIAKYYEKIGDHAVNIAQWVLYSITGTHVEAG